MKLLGVSIDELSPVEVLRRIELCLYRPSLCHVVTINPEYLVEATYNEAFFRVLNAADISTIDGFGIVVAKKYFDLRGEKKDSLFFGFLRFIWAYILVAFFRFSSVPRLTGVDLILLLVQQSFMDYRKVYLLGGRDNIAATAAHILQKVNPTITFRFSNGLSCVQNPDPQQDANIIADITDFRPDILLVAYGHPWQDLWIHRNRHLLPVRVAIGVGGAFDYIGRRVPRAPQWMRRYGLEWVYRFIRQPRRCVRIFRATFVFMKLVISS